MSSNHRSELVAKMTHDIAVAIAKADGVDPPIDVIAEAIFAVLALFVGQSKYTVLSPDAAAFRQNVFSDLEMRLMADAP